MSDTIRVKVVPVVQSLATGIFIVCLPAIIIMLA